MAQACIVGRRLQYYIGAPIATSAALQAVAVDDERRVDGCIVAKLDDRTLWIFDDDGTAPAGPGIVEPTTGLGQWVDAGGGGGAGVGSVNISSVRARTTAALPANTRVGSVLTGDANGALAAQDGVTLIAGEILLVANEVTALDNGPHILTQVGTGALPYILTRVATADTSAEVTAGMLQYISEGTTFGNEWAFLTTDDAIVLNTTALTYAMLPNLVDLASTANGLGAALIGVEDAAGSFAQTTTELVLSELLSISTSADVSLTTADTSLTTADTSLTTADTSLTTADTSLTTRVAAEESTSLSADTSHDLITSANLSTTTSGDLSLTTRLTTEESTSLSADTSHDLITSANLSTTTSGDLSLTTRLAAEESTSLSADTSHDLITSSNLSTTTSGDLSITTRLNILDNGWIVFNLMDFKEVDGGADVGNIAVNGGVLASDTGPILRAGTNQSQEINWVAANVDQIATQISLPADLDGTADVTVQLFVSTGNTNADPATFTVETSWDQAALVTDTATDGAVSGTLHTITATIANADIPAAPFMLSMSLIPAAHATDDVSLWGMRLLYTSTAT